MKFTKEQQKRLEELLKLKESSTLDDLEQKELDHLSALKKKFDSQEVKTTAGELEKMAELQAERIAQKAIAPLEEKIAKLTAKGGWMKAENSEMKEKRKEFVKGMKLIAQGRTQEALSSCAKALNTGTDADGGVLVDTEIEAEIIRVAEKSGVARRVCDFRTVSSQEVKIRKANGGAVVYWVDEGLAITHSQSSFGKLLLNCKKLAGVTTITEEMNEEDPKAFEIAIQDIVDAMTLDEDAQFATGDGTVFKGVLNEIGVVEVVMGTGKTTYDKVTGLKSLKNLKQKT